LNGGKERISDLSDRSSAFQCRDPARDPPHTTSASPHRRVATVRQPGDAPGGKATPATRLRSPHATRPMHRTNRRLVPTLQLHRFEKAE